MKFQHKDLPRLIANRPTDLRGVLVYGPDAGHVGETAEAIARSVAEDLADPFNVATLSADSLRQDPAALMDAATALSMIGGARLVRVRGATDALISRFEDLANAEAIEAIVVVEAGALDGRSKLRRLFEQKPTLAALACYGDDGPGLAALIRQVMKSHDIKLEPDALEYLAGNLGGDRRQTRGELEKLALMVGAGGEATLADVAASIGDSGSLALDDVVYATADGDGPGLDRALQRANADGENAVRILRSTITHFQRLHLAAAAVADGAAPQAVVGALRPPIFWSRKSRFEAQLRLWSVARLEQCLNRLFEAEFRCKSTGVPDDAVCAQTLIGICLTRRPVGRGTRS